MPMEAFRSITPIKIEKTDDEKSVFSTLIGAVLKQPLWDHRLPLEERSDVKKNKLWELVRIDCGGKFDISTLVSKWKYLRDKYAREKKALKHASCSGTERNAKVWGHYEELRFLDDVVAVEPMTTSNYSLENSKDTCMTDTSTSNSSTSSSTTIKKRKMQDHIGEAILAELKASRPKTQPLQPDSPVQHFPLYLMELMKDLPQDVKVELEEDILEVVFAAKKKA